MKHSIQKLVAALLISLHCATTAIADPINVRSVTGKGPTQEEAMQDASRQALKQAVSDLQLEATDTQLERMLVTYPEWLTRTILKIDKGDTSVSIQVDFAVDADAVRSSLVKREVASISEALGNPQIAFAIVPRAPEGQKLAPGTKQFFSEQINTALEEAFFDANFKSVYPDWLLKELNGFQGDPAHDEEFQLNTIYRAKGDPNTHYLVTGAATIDVQPVGGEVEVHLSINGRVLNTFTESSLSVPFQFTGSFRGATERVAIGQACSIVAERAAKNKAMPRLVADWNDQVQNGVIYALHILHDSAEFKRQIISALESAGSIGDPTTLSDNLTRYRYRTRVIPRRDFGDSMLLARHFKGWPANRPFYCAANQSELVIAPDKASFRKSAQALVGGQKYTLIDLKTLPPSLQENKTSDAAVHQDSDTALAMVARKYAEAVALVVCVNKDGSGWTATAWAFGSDLFASNGHVSQPAEQALGSGGEVYIYLNRGKGERLRVTAARTHPKYSEKTPLAAIYDVGVLEVAGKVKNYFPIAKENALRAVDSGTRVAFLGFPSGGLALNNFNLNSPIATMQSGIITAVSDYELGDSGYAGNILFRHNLASTTGASGSPVFDTQGAVVGILNAGSTITQVKRTRNRATGKEELTFEAAPSGVLINYAQRVDLLWDIVSRPK